ncbi:hypothetical protein J6590_027263 [Homalodisca vitripennis]|nr:hypothetical protein J6590_027263 [Homalodisca vitripennis]
MFESEYRLKHSACCKLPSSSSPPSVHGEEANVCRSKTVERPPTKTEEERPTAVNVVERRPLATLHHTSVISRSVSFGGSLIFENWNSQKEEAYQIENPKKIEAPNYRDMEEPDEDFSHVFLRGRDLQMFRTCQRLEEFTVDARFCEGWGPSDALCDTLEGKVEQ